MRPERLRRLVGQGLVEGIKDGARWKVSSVSVELYQGFKAESPSDYQGTTLMRIRAAAADTGIDADEIRRLIRQRKLAGRLRNWSGRDMVDVNSLWYLVWRRRREGAVRQLYGRGV